MCSTENFFFLTVLLPSTGVAVSTCPSTLTLCGHWPKKITLENLEDVFSTTCQLSFHSPTHPSVLDFGAPHSWLTGLSPETILKLENYAWGTVEARAWSSHIWLQIQNSLKGSLLYNIHFLRCSWSCFSKKKPHCLYPQRNKFNPLRTLYLPSLSSRKWIPRQELSLGPPAPALLARALPIPAKGECTEGLAGCSAKFSFHRLCA
jgi:hypothetical protein